MEQSNVKSGKEILDEFFQDILSFENVNTSIAESLAELYANGKLTDKNVINELQRLRNEDGRN